MDYKNFGVQINYDSVAQRFDGVVTGASQDVSFTGTSVQELRTNFRVAVDKHLADCKAKHIDAYRKFSGTIIIRVDEKLHRELFLKAQSERKSLNKWIEAALTESLAASS